MSTTRYCCSRVGSILRVQPLLSCKGLKCLLSLHPLPLPMLDQRYAWLETIASMLSSCPSTPFIINIHPFQSSNQYIAYMEGIIYYLHSYRAFLCNPSHADVLCILRVLHVKLTVQSRSGDTIRTHSVRWYPRSSVAVTVASKSLAISCYL